MDAKVFWNVFVDTGAPEAYLLYTWALKKEGSDVLDNTWFSPPGFRI